MVNVGKYTNKKVSQRGAKALFLAFILWSSTGFSQSKKELEKKKLKLQKEIGITNKLLQEAKKNKQTSLNQLVTLNKKIGMREELISTINTEIDLITIQIDQTNSKISNLHGELKELKNQYGMMIYYAYKNRSAYDRLMFIFSAKDFNQAYQRLKYLQQYADYRKQQALIIEATQSILNQKIKELEERKAIQQGLVKNKEQEKETLTKEKEEQEEVLVQLQSKEQKLKADLKKKQADASKLQQAIQKIIEAEIKKSKEMALKKKKEKAKKEMKEKLPTEKTIILTPEAEKLSATFESNKAKLPWPVAEGVIVSTFGEHDHPTLKGVKVKNNGIDISTSSASQVRAVFEGEVIGIASIPGAGKAVIVSHGKYITVYSNLQETFVKKGDKVSTKQAVGLARTDEDAKTEVHFEIWNGYTLLNPTAWIYKQ